MRPWLPFVAFAFSLSALAGCVMPAPAGSSNSPSSGFPFFPNSHPASAEFLAPFTLPASANASEPSIAIDANGTIYVSAPTGLPSASPLWRSTDGGKTWAQLSPNGASLGGPGLGGGDTSLALARDGSVYVTDLWAGSASVSSSHDGGATWFTSPIASEVPFYDRQWNAVDASGVAYFVGRTFAPGQAAWASRSTDGGVTWIAAGNPWVSADTSSENQDGPLVANPKTNALGLVYTCGGASVCFTMSADQGLTWNSVTVATGKGSVGNDFPALAADLAGNWYVAYSDLTKEGSAAWLASSHDGAKWSAPVRVAEAPGNQVFPWIVAGDAGRIALAWYGTSTPGDPNDVAAMKSAAWYPFVATSLDATAVAPHFTVASVSATPNHVGSVSTQGLPIGAANPPDRSLGDFFTIALDPLGRVNVAYVGSIAGHARLEWTRQDSGDSLYASGHAPVLPTAGNATLPLPVTPP